MGQDVIISPAGPLLHERVRMPPSSPLSSFHLLAHMVSGRRSLSCSTVLQYLGQIQGFPAHSQARERDRHQLHHVIAFPAYANKIRVA